MLRAKGDRSLRDKALPVGDKGLDRVCMFHTNTERHNISSRETRQQNHSATRILRQFATYFETTKALDPFPSISRATGWSVQLLSYFQFFYAVITDCTSLNHNGYIIKEMESDNYMYIHVYTYDDKKSKSSFKFI